MKSHKQSSVQVNMHPHIKRERERERYFEMALTKNERLRSRHPGSAVSALWVSYILDTYIKKRSENNN